MLAAKLEALAAAAGKAPPAKRDACGQPGDRLPVELARIDPAATDPSKRILPAQMAYLSPALPDTLILTEVVA